MADQLDEQFKKTIDAFIEADARGSSSTKEHKAKIAELRKQIEKEKTKPPPQHPALTFGPIAQTVACMAITSLGLNIAGLARRQTVYERMISCESEMQRAMRDFAVVFVRMSIGAVAILVAYTAIILYGYQSALTSLASSKKEEKSDAELKLAALLKGKPDRPDMWAHTRSHPSAFLSTKKVAPRIFPFPLGKTECKAQVKEELWWEGGNPPHVGHYNRPKLAPTTAPLDEAKLVARVKKKMEIEAQRGLWSRRIQSIQILSGIAMVYFVSSTIAIMALLWLIYTTLMREIDNMLQPPTDWSAIYAYIDQISMTGARTQSAPKSDIKKRIPPGGMTYIYDPISTAGGVVNKNSNIPIVGGPAPVLMTTQNHWYAGP